MGRAVQVQYVHIIQMCCDSGESVNARHWVEQGHVFGTVERQTLGAVMVHHLRDAGKHTAALVQGVAVFFSLSDDDVNAALARPSSQRRGGGEEEQPHSVRLSISSEYWPCGENEHRLITSSYNHVNLFGNVHKTESLLPIWRYWLSE